MLGFFAALVVMFVFGLGLSFLGAVGGVIGIVIGMFFLNLVLD